FAQFLPDPIGYTRHLARSHTTIVATQQLQYKSKSQPWSNRANSKAADWYVHQVGVTRSGGYMEYKPVFVEQIPIPQNVPEKERTRIASLAQAIQSGQREEVPEYEEQINDIVCDLYGINNREIRILQ
ncbi:hypothetical protein, partial [Bifidobacterium breve]